MQTLLAFFRNFGLRRVAILGAAAAITLGLFAWLLLQAAKPEMAMLYGDLDTADQARVVAQLDQLKLPYELRNGGNAIFVASDQVARTRLALAEKGLPAGGSLGYELFDNADTLGSTSFTQNVKLVRALEGELARSIRAFEQVKTARVHLVLPKRELFSREQQQPSTAVMLQMRGSQRLGPSQVVAVQHLVASAVPGLSPNRVSVVDGQGTLLSEANDGDDIALASAKADERRRRFETRLANTIEQLLARTVGNGKVRAEVYTDMDFDRINTSEEIFDPDSQVVRSTQSVNESNNNSENEANLPVSVATNLPDVNNANNPAGSANASAQKRNEETVNYEISKKVINHVRETGVVRRISVAVLIDGTYGAGSEGARSYQPRSQEELDRLATLVKSTVGFHSERGDTVEVINMRFSEAESATDSESAMPFGLDKGDLFRALQYLGVGALAAIALLFVVRPVVSRTLELTPLPVHGASGAAAALLPGRGTPPALTGPAKMSVAAVGGEDAAIGDEELIDLERVEGRVRASSVKRVGEIVEKHPEESLAIVRSWLHAED